MSTRPNVVFILTDDQGPWALGAAGNAEIHTPHLNGLAARGTRAEHFFCVSPVCSPARASLLTGQVPSRHGVHDWLDGRHTGDDGIDFLAGQHTYIDDFAAAGYRIGHVGKWHLGANDQPRAGFDRWFAYGAGGGPYYGAELYDEGRPLTEPGYLTDRLTLEAVRFIEDHDQAQTPFYLSLHYTAPHSPWAGQHPEEFTDLYADCPFDSAPQEPLHPWVPLVDGRPLGGEHDARTSLIGYYAAVSAMDAGVGAVLGALEAAGLTDNTLVVFTSDNGFNTGHHGIWGKGNATYPQNMYEESVTVPFIAAWPEVVAAGQVTTALLSGYDVAATLRELCALPGEERPGPGRSFAGILTGQHCEPRDHVVVFDEYGPVRMIRTRNAKYVHRSPSGPHELYDLDHDRGERHNLVDEKDYAELRTQLRAQLGEWFNRHGDPVRDGAALPVTGAGQLDPVTAGTRLTAFVEPTLFDSAPRYEHRDSPGE